MRIWLIRILKVTKQGTDRIIIVLTSEHTAKEIEQKAKKVMDIKNLQKQSNI